MINLFNNKYPYTDFHELNLDWLLQTYQEIVDRVNELLSWMSTHKVEYAEAMQRLEAVENEINTFEDEVRALFEQLKEEQEEAFAEQQAKLDRALASMEARIDAKIIEFQREFEQALADFKTELTQFKLQIEREINAMRDEVNRAIIWLNSQLDANNEYMFNYIENRLDQFIRDFPTLVNIPVYNPVRGETTTLQTAINDLYELSRFYALTAYQYDILGLTAEEYDNKQLTAIDYDQRGYILLGYPNENWYMINPFTGVNEKVKDVVYYLASLHMEALTATEYDDKLLDADAYDALLLTAYQYDTMGKALIV